jgi:hypothetical protein
MADISAPMTSYGKHFIICSRVEPLFQSPTWLTNLQLATDGI